MSFVEYTESELTRIPKDEDGMQDLVNRNILEIVKAFSEQGHSGLSASYVLSKLERLLRFKPISPLTGADDEWTEVHSQNGIRTYQNKRCSSIFKDVDAQGNVIQANKGFKPSSEIKMHMRVYDKRPDVGFPQNCDIPLLSTHSCGEGLYRIHRRSTAGILQ